MRAGMETPRRDRDHARGVVRAQHPGQGGLGVVGGDPDGVGEQLAFLVQQPGVRADLASWAAFHRHSVVSPIPNPAATAAEEAIPVATSCTAASRRPTSSSVANANVACPNTNTASPSAPSTRPAAEPIGVASAGSSGSTGWRTRPALPPPSTGSLSQRLSQSAGESPLSETPNSLLRRQVRLSQSRL